MARLDQTPKTVSIVDLSLDGRGVARWPEGHANAGKAVFVSGALPGETVIEASPDRVEPRCPHFGTCGGCVLQHFAEERQIESKQRVLLENLQRIGHVSQQSVLPPLRGDSWGYRRKGRFSVRRVEKKDKTLVGFREQDPRFVADIGECHVVVPQLGFKVAALGALVDGLDARRDIPQIEFIAGDAQIALVFRHLQPLSDADKAKLAAFAEAEGFSIFLQPGGIDSVHPLTGDAPQLSFRLPQWDIELLFRPLDFIQVNAKLNEAMIARALELLDVQPGERVLDLFCGLGNFTLPLARAAGDGELVQRARANAAHNGLGNATFHAADLVQDLAAQPWLKAGFDKLLLDPARSGAIEVLKQLPLKGLKRIVYVSCHPGSLARDAGFLVNDAGWTLREAGVMDMFPHTAHVESIAVFDPPKKR